MKKGNVLVIGNSGVGKSTLINAVVGDDVAKTSWGDKGGTLKVDLYNGELFNVIDTIGFEPSFLKANKAIIAVKKWSKDSAKEENEDKQINVIWFCVDGTSRKLFPKAIKDLSKAISMWKSVPIITVITKSYSVPERVENIELVKNVFNKNKDLSERLKAVIPVVASTYVLNDEASAPPEGIAELIEKTNELMPEGMKAAQKDIAKFNLLRRRTLAQGAIAASTGAAIAKTFINVGMADSIVISKIENTLVDTLAKIYNVDKDSQVVVFIKNNIANGNVYKFAKIAIDTIDKLPYPQIKELGSTVINPLVAAVIVVALGETAAKSLEKIYLGEDTSETTKIFSDFLENEFVSEIVDSVKEIISNLTSKSTPKEIADATINSTRRKKNK